IVRVQLSRADSRLWTQHHSANLCDKHETSKSPLAAQTSGPKNDITTVPQGCQYVGQMASINIQAEYHSYENQQKGATIDNKGDLGWPRIQRAHGCVTSYRASPVISPNAPPAVEPTNEPTPTTAATQATPPNPVVAPSAKQILPLARNATSPPPYPPSAEPVNLPPVLNLTFLQAADSESALHTS